MLYKFSLFFLFFVGFTSCSDTNKPKTPITPFTLLSSQQTNIDFSNEIEENLYFNFLNYPYIYNGGGVAVGDINNDGFEDVYFSSNQSDNKLYLNQGEFNFKDITTESGTKDNKGWTTGVSMVDINNDGWLDIYVCKSGSLENHKLRENKLYINQKDNTFIDQAPQYGLNQNGFSTQAYFLDFDKDGDLDMYLVNHRADFRNNVYVEETSKIKKDALSSDHLFRNDNGKFVDITTQAGVANKAWGLSASIGDFNNDNWPDIFVANDFLQPDYLYINNHDGTFTEKALDYFKHISTNSMGCDFADINNDLKEDLIVLEMAPAERARSKQNMASMDVQNFDLMVNSGYHYQYMRNMLQLNNGNNTYSEIGQIAGITQTDWSWSPLIIDFNNDGYNDLFISNGIKHDLANSDYRAQMQHNIKNQIKVSLDDAIAMMPSTKQHNYLFINNKDFTFEDKSKDYGFLQEINSNGATYADLDNDGDLDIILNNQSDIASIYRNNTTNNYLTINFNGEAQNINGIGTRVNIYYKKQKQTKSLYLSRGYQSSVGHNLNFGLGNTNKIDSIKVSWGNGKQQVVTDIKPNRLITFDIKDAKNDISNYSNEESVFEKVPSATLGVDFKHTSTVFNDYSKQLLLPQKQSTIDNAIAVADVNNDGLDDFFVGNTKGHAGELYLQKSDGRFRKSSTSTFEKDKEYTDNQILFFDADNDADLDLYITSGNYNLDENSYLMQDRLYINDGNGVFAKQKNLPKINSVTKAVAAYDYDQDGDLDLFIGGRVVPSKYPNAPESYVLNNNNGKFVEVTNVVAPDFKKIGMVNEIIFSDYDQDGDDDMIVAGEWMPISFFNNTDGVFSKNTQPTDSIVGWFQTIKSFDFDNDGDKDYLVGNMGENNKFHPSIKKPLHIFANYFDDNLSYDTALSKISNGKLYPARGKECSTQQTPFLEEKITSYKSFADATITDVYGEEKINNSLHLSVTNFHSFMLINDGKGAFSAVDLPIEAQFGPTLGFEIIDINNDGKNEILGIGDIYDAEVETIRYDASRGYILSEKDNSFKTLRDANFITNHEVKAIKKILIKSNPYLMLLNADNELTFLKIKK